MQYCISQMLHNTSKYKILKLDVLGSVRFSASIYEKMKSLLLLVLLFSFHYVSEVDAYFTTPCPCGWMWSRCICGRNVRNAAENSRDQNRRIDGFVDAETGE
ncbi:uncharacterized protein LOC134273485 [Saccostrea cucullata]|uniref:uncharacterized protein LOC134273485 n=1 Tax=Saccostrea cuccullata TaxID=36930 RepID=UPI002ED6BAF2